MRQFKLRAGGFVQIRKRLLLRFAPMFLALALGVFALKLQQAGTDEASVAATYISLPVLVLVIAGASFWAVNRQKPWYESYVLTIDGPQISRQQINLPNLTLHRDEITCIVQLGNGNLIIYGKTKGNAIAVPREIADYEGLLQALQPFGAISAPGFYETGMSPLAGFALLFMMGCLYFSSNAIMVVGCSVGFLVMMLWSLIIMHQNKNIGLRLMLQSWLIWIALSIIVGVNVLKTLGIIGLKQG